ncbi:MAG: dienelactone hydrolase family protein [Asticcacaulis sp.]|uniref:dienelactone hydrolase family protein n=1 Tax=Asticcacaulis sp. TaxID=1872648 RepID=UPI0039E6A642
MEKIEIKTRDGICPAFVFRPEGQGAWPAVLMYMDGPGMRPAMQAVAARLSTHGYYVLLPDLFYRSGPYEPIDTKVVWANKELREAHRAKFMDPAKPAAIMSDTAAFLDFLTEQPDVKAGPIGVDGYCMGGRLALIAAGTYPERIAVATAYHGGGLANDTPSSPHLLAPKMKAKIYVGGATDDANFDDSQKTRLEDALTEAGVDHLIETYPAKHGWVLSDMPVHDPVEAEHHWQTLVPVLDSVLKV